MFLKQLEIIGFKSFAQKIAIEFVPGVTAVVGPNGSGKSNITDAIKWVLGEQSAKSLRGAKMEDIIFAGSENKRPLNMAEVTLVLDNNDHYMNVDYSEISVTRRVFRSGESEFFLNGQRCRLKDIVDLFMDSGLGREAYSIISQGKIDDILNSKAEEKRKIFEEAAGVLKYKTRKLSAEKKLNESQENLNRVEDILHELEGQVEPLEEQASVAKEFLEKKDELETIEVALLAHDIGNTHEKWEERSSAVEKLKEQSLNQGTDINSLEAEHEKDQTYLQALDESIEELQESLLLASENVEKFEGEKRVLAERQKHAEENAEQLGRRIDELEQKKQHEEKTLEVEKVEWDKQKQYLTEIEQELSEKTNRFEHFEKDIEERLEQLKSDYFDLLNVQASVRNEMRYLEEQSGQIAKKAERVNQEFSEADERAAQIEDRRQEAMNALEAKASQLAEEQVTLKALIQSMESAQSNLEKRREALQKVEQYGHQAKSRRDMLKDMEEDFAGFYGGVKTVLKAREKGLKGIHGAIAELVRVNKSYETAIETALGAAMQHVVVDNEQHAREAIQFLKSRKAGRATFLPLSVIKHRFVSDHDLRAVQNEEAFVGTGDSLVNYDNKYHGVIRHLLGHIIIAKDLKGAGQLAKVSNYRYRIVTLDGDVVSPGGAMSGGSRKQTNTNILGRSQEIERLDKQLAEMKEKHSELKKEASELTETLRSEKAKSDTLRQTIAQYENEKRELEASLKEIEFEAKNIAERRGLLERDRGSYDTEQKSVEERLSALQAKLGDVAEQEAKMKAEIETLTHQKKNQEEAKEALQSEITDLKVSVARQQETVSAQEEKRKRLTDQLSTIANELDSAKQAISALDQSLSGQKLDQETLDSNIENSRRDKEAITAWISERRGGRLDVHNQMKTRENELKEAKRLLKGTDEALRREEIALERLDVELDNLLNALREDYEMGYESAKEKYPLELSPDDARKQVKLLKRAIEELGTVNIGAIEEYERVSTRLNFLVEQREDLLQAKETLLGVIDEMDEEVRKRFKETFDQVAGHFGEVFKELFGGGRASLELTDPEDLLYSGVDILAQPPGKKLQHLSLLSGGERALTAIALLFAILKVRPVPFCVLDEVEAALDDANVDRYADFLKNFSRETQFIVVTHRKGTMEQADVLYGVTMQESGVSKLVSVRLEETEELVG